MRILSSFENGAAVDLGSDFSAIDLSRVKIGWLGSLDGYFALETGILDLCRDAMEEINRRRCRRRGSPEV